MKTLPKRILHYDTGGGASVAARAHSEQLGVPLVNVANDKSFFGVGLKALAKCINYVFRKKGEDYIWPIFFCAGSFSVKDGDELHWVLGPGLNSKSLKGTRVTLYMHDEWWTNGWSGYRSLDSEFEFLPTIFPLVRNKIRGFLSRYSKSTMEQITKNAILKVPSKYLKTLIAEQSSLPIEYDASQQRFMQLPSAPCEKTVHILFYAPTTSPYRKGSDLTLELSLILGKKNVAKDLIVYTVGGSPNISGYKEHQVRPQMCRKEFLELLQRTKVLVFLTRKDNLPNIVVEALSLDCMVLTSQFSGATECEFGRGVTVVDIEELTTCADVLLTLALSEEN